MKPTYRTVVTAVLLSMGGVALFDTIRSAMQADPEETDPGAFVPGLLAHHVAVEAIPRVQETRSFVEKTTRRGNTTETKNRLLVPLNEGKPGKQQMFLEVERRDQAAFASAMERTTRFTGLAVRIDRDVAAAVQVLPSVTVLRWNETPHRVGLALLLAALTLGLAAALLFARRSEQAHAKERHLIDPDLPPIALTGGRMSIRFFVLLAPTAWWMFDYVRWSELTAYIGWFAVLFFIACAALSFPNGGRIGADLNGLRVARGTTEVLYAIPWRDVALFEVGPSRISKATRKVRVRFTNGSEIRIRVSGEAAEHAELIESVRQAETTAAVAL